MSRAVTIVATMLLALAGPSCALRPMSSTPAEIGALEPVAIPPEPTSAPAQQPAQPQQQPPPEPAATATATPSAIEAVRSHASADSSAPSTSGTPTPKLLTDTDPTLGQDVRVKLDRARDLVVALERRSLSIEQADLLLAGRQFVGQGTDAIAAADLQRASVLVDKALVMLQELEQSTRP